MAKITASMVKDLRERTGLGMMDCKQALTRTNGEMEQAIEDLRKASGLKAARKANRIAAEGLILARIAEEGNYGVILEVNSETDFVARDDNFQQFAEDALAAAYSHREADIPAILDSGLEDSRQSLVQKLGENINLRRVDRIDVNGASSGVVESYVHHGKIGVLIALDGGSESLARDIAMHVAAVNPMVMSAGDIPEELLAKESEIYAAQARESGKPEQFIGKIIEGRLRKYKAEVSLLEQPFVRNPETRVGDLLKQAGAEIIRYVRFEVGEGIEKEEEDFAAEVAAQLAS